MNKSAFDWRNQNKKTDKEGDTEMERNNARLPTIHSSNESGTCPECGNRSLKHHKREGEIVCEKCGFVLKDKTFGQLGKGTRKGSGGIYKKFP